MKKQTAELYHIYIYCTFSIFVRYASADGASRRKNATRETTSTQKAWLQEHQKNPYPTKGEKIMLAIITKMTLTQVTSLGWHVYSQMLLSVGTLSGYEVVNMTHFI